MLIEPHDDGGAPGLAIAPYALGDAPGLIDLGGGRYIEIGPAASEAARLILAPGAAPRLDGPGSGLDVAVGATFAQPVLVFGVPGLGVSATGFRLAGRVVDGAVEVELGTAPGLTVGLSLGNDSFMRSLLGDATDVTVDAGMIWRQGSALRFSAGADLSFELPLDDHPRPNHNRAHRGRRRARRGARPVGHSVDRSGARPDHGRRRRGWHRRDARGCRRRAHVP